MGTRRDHCVVLICQEEKVASSSYWKVCEGCLMDVLQSYIGYELQGRA